MVDKFIIYGLVDPRTGQLRYVGKSVKGLRRPRSHMAPWVLKKEGHTHKGHWVKSIVDAGLRPKIVIIEALDSPTALYEHEHFWVTYFRAMGCPLTNATDGGAGTLGHRHSLESRAKQSAVKKGKPQPDAVLAMIASNRGRKHGPRSKSWCAKLSASTPWKKGLGPNSGRIFDAEWRINNSRAQGGRPFIDQNQVRYETIHEAARLLELQATKICAVLKGHRRTTGGLSFRYVVEEG
jgi:hypothetical protein